MAATTTKSGKGSNLRSPRGEQLFKNIRFDRPMWEGLNVLARAQSNALMLNVSAADLVRKFIQEGLDRAAQANGRTK